MSTGRVEIEVDLFEVIDSLAKAGRHHKESKGNGQMIVVDNQNLADNYKLAAFYANRFVDDFRGHPQLAEYDLGDFKTGYNGVMMGTMQVVAAKLNGPFQ
jgi:hypothetical protein